MDREVAITEQTDVENGNGCASCCDRERSQCADPHHEQDEDRRRSPPPGGSLQQCGDDRAESGHQQRHPGQIPRLCRVRVRCRAGEMAEDHGGDPDRNVDEKTHLPGEDLGTDSSDDGTDEGETLADSRVDRHRARPSRFVDGLDEQSEGCRHEHRTGDAGQCSTGHDRFEGRHRRDHRRRGDEADHPDSEHPRRTVRIGEAAAHRGEHREHQQIDRYQPRRLAHAEIQIPHHGGQHDAEDAGIENEQDHRRGGRDQQECLPATGSSLCPGRSRRNSWFSHRLGLTANGFHHDSGGGFVVRHQLGPVVGSATILAERRCGAAIVTGSPWVDVQLGRDRRRTADRLCHG